MCRGYLQPLYLHVSDLEIVLRFSKDDTELSSAAFVAALLADETGGGPPQSGGGAIVLLVAKLNLGACHHGIAEKCRSESNA
jgi:hypothetical protein